MRIILITLLLLSSGWNTLRAQRAELPWLGAEGANLFVSETASWYGTDLALEAYPVLRDELGDYCSYGTPEDAVTTMHTPVLETGPFITATDMCTFGCMKRFAGWKEHLVLSQTDVSTSNCAYDMLVDRPKGAGKSKGRIMRSPIDL